MAFYLANRRETTQSGLVDCGQMPQLGRDGGLYGSLAVCGACAGLSWRLDGAVTAVEGLLLLLAIAAGAWFWLDSARAREMATGLARELCKRHGLQFLDGTAALERLGLRWTSGGVRVRRVFRFDFSEAGIGRHSGRLILVGIELEAFSLGSDHREPGSGPENAEQTAPRRWY